MMSTLMLSLSVLCFAAMFGPRKSASRPSKEVYTYYVCGDEPLPTWQRKVAPPERAAARQG